MKNEPTKLASGQDVNCNGVGKMSYRVPSICEVIRSFYKFVIKRNKSNYRLIIYGAVSGFLFYWGDRLHSPIWLWLLLNIGGCILSACCARQFLINFSKGRLANCCGLLVLGVSVTFTGIDFGKNKLTSNVSLEDRPLSGLEFEESLEEIHIIFGGMDITLDSSWLSQDPAKRIAHVISVDGIDPIVPYIENGRLFCDVEFCGIYGMPPIKLKHKTLSGRPPHWDMQQSDKAIEVVTDELIPVFQMFYSGDNQIVINGVFLTPSKILLCSELETKMISLAKLDNVYPTGVIPVSTRRIFKYPSWKYPGEIETNSN